MEEEKNEKKKKEGHDKIMTEEGSIMHIVTFSLSHDLC